MEPTLTHAGTPKSGDGDLVKDTTTQSFMADVIDASREALVLVDFWAPWCGPCKQLTPVLERAVKAAGGAVKLVKLNIDEHPAIPSQMGIQSIPAVFAFKDGRPVDGFMGALPESQVKSFIEKHMDPSARSAAGAALEEAQAALEAGDTVTAAQIFGALLQKDPDDPEAAAGLALCRIEEGALDEAAALLDALPADKAAAAPVARARAALELARKAGESGDVEALRAQVEREPDDLQARFDLAIALNAAGARSEAVEQLLEIMTRDRGWNDDAARKQLVEFFEAWGASDPATIEGRRRLSTLLFS
ncbi:MAG: thioredoxin [Methyloligellaceae bacterium]